MPEPESARRTPPPRSAIPAGRVLLATGAVALGVCAIVFGPLGPFAVEPRVRRTVGRSPDSIACSTITVARCSFVQPISSTLVPSNFWTSSDDPSNRSIRLSVGTEFVARLRSQSTD